MAKRNILIIIFMYFINFYKFLKSEILNYTFNKVFNPIKQYKKMWNDRLKSYFYDLEDGSYKPFYRHILTDEEFFLIVFTIINCLILLLQYIDIKKLLLSLIYFLIFIWKNKIIIYNSINFFIFDLVLQFDIISIKVINYIIYNYVEKTYCLSIYKELVSLAHTDFIFF